MNLPNPPDKYEKDYFQRLLGRLEWLLNFVYFRDRDVIIEPKTRFILVAPNGNKYAVKVTNEGNLFTELV